MSLALHFLSSTSTLAVGVSYSVDQTGLLDYALTQYEHKIYTSKPPRPHTTSQDPCTTLQEGGCYKTAILVLSTVECAPL